MDRLEIQAAKHGGYIVTGGATYRSGELAYPLFAGSLADCLDFMRTHLSGGPQADEPLADSNITFVDIGRRSGG